MPSPLWVHCGGLPQSPWREGSPVAAPTAVRIKASVPNTTTTAMRWWGMRTACTSTSTHHFCLVSVWTDFNAVISFNCCIGSNRLAICAKLIAKQTFCLQHQVIIKLRIYIVDILHFVGVSVNIFTFIVNDGNKFDLGTVGLGFSYL